MPDENKFGKLREIGYTVNVTCGLCRHSRMEMVGRQWGICTLHRYVHEKHTTLDEGRGVSVHASGSCPSGEVDPTQVSVLGAHAEFLRPEVK